MYKQLFPIKEKHILKSSQNYNLCCCEYCIKENNKLISLVAIHNSINLLKFFYKYHIFLRHLD